MGIEPTTSSLGSLRSTTELHPRAEDRCAFFASAVKGGRGAGKEVLYRRTNDLTRWVNPRPARGSNAARAASGHSKAMLSYVRWYYAEADRALASFASLVMASQSPLASASLGATHEPPTQTTLGSDR